jgi:hypothetical protein
MPKFKVTVLFEVEASTMELAYYLVKNEISFAQEAGELTDVEIEVVGPVIQDGG